MAKIKIVYDPIKGLVVPDGKIYEFIDNLWKSAQNLEDCGEKEPMIVYIGSETILHEMRARHYEKTIVLDEIIVFRKPDEDILLVLDSSGRIDKWPEGFCDVTDKALMRLLYQGNKNGNLL